MIDVCHLEEYMTASESCVIFSFREHQCCKYIITEFSEPQDAQILNIRSQTEFMNLLLKPVHLIKF